MNTAEEDKIFRQGQAAATWAILAPRLGTAQRADLKARLETFVETGVMGDGYQRMGR